MKKSLLLFLLMLSASLQAQVTIRDTLITWHTFNYSLTENNTISWSSEIEYDTIPKTFFGYVLENEYLKITLVPEFGGRILSMIYKPTGKEQLYQNPAGAPYGIGQDWFYYSWLMVYGGIFPTLTEPEHGKAWFLPWKFTVLKETPDTIRCSMSWSDTVNREGIDPGKWKYGKTNLKCDYTLTLIKGASALEADISLYNDSNESLEYEYWTCLTLAPGSDPADPKTTEGAELIIPAVKVKIPSWYPDIARQEKRIPGTNGVYTFTNLRKWKNWPNDGIAYPWDDTDENYWGVINHDSEEGFIRLSENNITPGIKIWAWGYQQSQDIDPFKDPELVRRPYIELWAGHSNEFFEPAYIAANSAKQWKEIYVPTVGISGITDTGNDIIAEVKVMDESIVNLGFVTTRPDNEFDVKIEITGHNPAALLTQTILYDAIKGGIVATDLPDNQTWTDEDSLVYTIASANNGIFFSSAKSLKNIITGLTEDIVSPEDFMLFQNYPNPSNPVTKIRYSIGSSQFVTMKVYDILGKELLTLVNEEKSTGTHEVVLNAANLSSGIYFYKIQAGSFTDTKKLVVIQ